MEPYDFIIEEYGKWLDEEVPNRKRMPLLCDMHIHKGRKPKKIAIGILTLVGLGLNIIGALILLTSNKELIKSIINSFKRIECNMNIGSMGDEQWFPNGWEKDFERIVKVNNRTNAFAFIALAIGFTIQFFTTAIGVI